jgi:hypothetical protein
MDESVAYESCDPRAALPASRAGAGNRLNFYLWLLLTVTNVVDVLGTRRAFSIGVHELNPIVEFFYAQFGMISIAFAKAVFLVLLYFLIPYIRGWNRALFVFACCVYLALTVAHVWYLSPLL